MATWEDGPEYAPLERPADYGEPTVAPLQEAEVVTSLSAGAPRQQPRFDAPTTAVAPLATLVPAESGPRRDPQQPFAVAAATMTPDPTGPLGAGPYGSGPEPQGPFTSGPYGAPAHPGAWGAAHWSPPPRNSAPGTVRPGPSAPWGPPSGDPWPAPTDPFPTNQAPAPPGGFPAPGSPQWFGPGPSSPIATAPTVDAKAVWNAATPALLVTLAIGLVYYLAPFTLCVAFFLTTRLRVARTAVQRAFLGGLGLLALVAMLAALTNLGGFSDWWGVVGRWALVISLVLVGVVLVLVRRALLAGGAQPPRWP